MEVRLIDLVAAYGAFGNGGKVTRPRHILKVEDSEGRVIYRAGQPATKQVWSPQAAYLMADILAGNTDPRENLVWGKRFPLRNGPGRSYRVAALKTGTTNDLRDYSTYGLVPMPRSRKEPAVAAGFWFGNSDHSSPRLSPPVYSMDNAGQAWHGFMREYLRGKPTATFRRPDGIVTATIDRFTGGLPGPWTLGTVQEIFIEGTQPGGRREVEPSGPAVLRWRGHAPQCREPRRPSLVDRGRQLLGSTQHRFQGRRRRGQEHVLARRHHQLRWADGTWDLRRRCCARGAGR